MNASPTASPITHEMPGASFSDPTQLLLGVGVVLGFGLIAIAIVAIFILLAQGRYFDAVESLARRGMSTSPGQTQATIGGLTARGGAAAPDIKVAGPQFLRVGEPVEYTATQNGRSVSVAWEVQGTDTVTVEPPTGDRVRVTASEPGPFALVAKVASRPEQPAILVVTAEKSGNAATVLGYVGAGWGAIVVSIVVAAIVAALGIAGVLDGQAIAGIYGALIGYLFGYQLRSAGTSSGGGSTDTAGSD
jgi:hypothetical protein